MALQTANQFQLTPNLTQAISGGLNVANQFRAGQAQDQSSQILQQNQDQQIAQQEIIGTANAAVEIQNLPDQESRVNALRKRSQTILDRGGDNSDTQELLSLYESGQTDKADSLLNSAVQTFTQQGFLKAPEKALKPTASQQDFDTFKQLNARALKTGDPLDAQLAQQFGQQSGFDRATPQELADIDVQKTSKIELTKQAAKASKEAFDSLKGVRKTISNMDDALAALNKGAATGPAVSKLPSFRQASIELDNIKGRMGLDVVGSTTFGALSESELAFALDTALPDSLEPEALKDWITRKRDAQKKMADELRKAASFLGQPGNTIAGFLEQQEKANPNVSNLSDDELFN